MKVLILNGSPRNNGDTIYVINKLKGRLPDDTIFEEINAYTDNIKPCIDCRYCWENKGCAIHDRMEVITRDDYDIAIIASPVYMSYVTPPLFSIFTRFNYMYSNKQFMGISNNMKKKKGILVLVGGGDGSPEGAINISMRIFRKMNADFDLEKNYICSLNTDTISVKQDKELIKQIDRTVEYILRNK